MKIKNKLSLNRMFIYVFALLLPSLPLSATVFAPVTLTTSTSFIPSSFTLNTDISTTSVPNASVSSFFDANHNTHIAWVAVTATGEQVMYGKYTSAGVFTSTTVSEVFYRVKAVAIVTDDSNNPHITYIIKRDENPEYTFTRTGNYAVYYAGSSDAGVSFSSNQVSTNVADRTDDSDGIYHCYVNGRPQIGIDPTGQIQIMYSSSSSSLTGYDNWEIKAVGTGSGSWTRTQEFNIGDFYDTMGVFISHDHEFEMLPRPTAGNYLAWIDTSNYDPQFLYNNTNITISGYAGLYDNKHAQIDVDDSGNVHYFWLQDATDVLAFHHTILNGNSYGTVNQIDIATEADGSLKSVTGNLRPTTIDPVTGKIYFIYYEGVFGTVSGTFLIEYDPSTQTSQEFELSNVGSAYGKRSLNVHNGFISLVGGDNGSTLFINHLDANTLGVINAAPTISGTPASSITVGQSYSFTPSANDTDGDTLTYSVTNLPLWAILINTTGNLSGTPQAGAEGVYDNITISVSDGTDTVSLPAFSITVDPVAVSNNAPVISGTPSTSVEAGQSYSFIPAASDLDGDTLSFTSSNLPIWMGMDTGTGAITGSPQAIDEGLYSNIVITVSDGTDTASLAPFSIEVTSAVIIPDPVINTTPVISGTATTSIDVDSVYSFTPTASDTDGDNLTFTVKNSPSWASFNNATGTLSGTPLTGDENTYSSIMISVTDGTDTTSLASFSITVNAVAQPKASGSSSGGGSLTPFWMLFILLQCWLRRR